MTEQGEQIQLPPKKIAFIIDGIVVDVLHTDARLGSIFLSEPEIIDVTDVYTGDVSFNMSGWTYDGNTFSPPTN
jgi:hypothetical protein